ncbi:protein MEI2-like 6 [Lolium rigidum]|uniref:protein MEI2-like 6 n=1 Tax=Lolium rigidum TaxID=89674 RepID=UPI001F5E0588|nr:protein MEI2-like 6 [Lolium rigidum]
MAAVSRLNPVASPFFPMTLLPAGCYLSPTPAASMPSADFFASHFLYPQPPHPPAYGWPVACGNSWFPSGGFTVGVPAFPLQAAYGHPLQPPPVTVYCCTPPPPPPPPQPAAPRCRITEIFEDGGEAAVKLELRDEPSPRSVLATWSREPNSPRERRMPPPPPTSFVRKLLPRPRRWPLLAFNPSDNFTSLMIRNIPNKFMKKGFMAILDQHCAEENAKLGGDSEAVKSEYDFLYVPIDFETRYNKGYAFVNMTTAVAARRLHAYLDGRRWEVACSKKVCDVVHARVEGLDSLVAHFSGSRFPCGGQKEFLPVRFVPPRDGVRKTAEHVVGRLLPRRHG